MLPVLVLISNRNPKSRPAQDQARLAELLGGEQLMVDNSRHMIMLDRPDMVAAAGRRFRP